MRELTYFVAVTMDGFICAPDGSFDAFPNAEDTGAFHIREYPELVPTHVRGRLGLDLAPNQKFDTLIQGRGSYQVALDEGITSPYAHLRQYVPSTTLAPDTDPDVEIFASDPLEKIRELKKEDTGLGICLVGGATLAGALVPEIDALFIKRYPVVFGSGLPLFKDAAYTPTDFTMVEQHRFGSGADYTLYRKS